MNHSPDPYVGSQSIRPGRFDNIIPENRKARITYWNGKVSVINGPARKPLFSNIDIFNQITVPEGERGYLIEEQGQYQEIIGPVVVDIHPDGAYKSHYRWNLAN